MLFPFQPMPLVRRAAPFNHPEWLYEIKHDGFRALAYLRNRECTLVSRTGYVYKRFGDLCGQLAASLSHLQTAVLDGEIVCLDDAGKSQFNQLLYRRGTPYFYAFDLLELNGRDVCGQALLERKAKLRHLIRPRQSALLYVDHLEHRGAELYQLVCREDLEGIVAKWKEGRYTPERVSSWIKVKNPAYTQMVGRSEIFEKRMARKPASPASLQAAPW